MNHILVVKPLDVYSGTRLLKCGRVLHDYCALCSQVEAKRAQPRAQTVSRNGSFPEQNYSAGKSCD